MGHYHHPRSLAELEEINKSLTVRRGTSLLEQLLRDLLTQSLNEKLHFIGSEGGRQT